MKHLRVIDAGQVSALRSQALWHGIAGAMTQHTVPTLSLCRPDAPYVGLGYHRSLEELDLEACERMGLSVIRRQIGGGPVYVDSDQLFFQITLPAEHAPMRVDRLYAQMLAPVVQAFRSLGLDARIRGLNDISIEDRRLSGTGAGRIGNGVTVVGNVIFRFPHRRTVRTLALPTPLMRQECLRLMQKHVTSLQAEGLGQITMAEARTALIEAFAHGLDLTPEPDFLSSDESAAINDWERRFETRSWLEGPDLAPPSSASRQIKISADAWCYAARRDDLALHVSFRNETIESIDISSSRMNGAGEAIAERLTGCPITELERRLEPFGGGGRSILELLEAGTVLR